MIFGLDEEKPGEWSLEEISEEFQYCEGNSIVMTQANSQKKSIELLPNCYV